MPTYYAAGVDARLSTTSLSTSSGPKSETAKEPIVLRERPVSCLDTQGNWHLKFLDPEETLPFICVDVNHPYETDNADGTEGISLGSDTLRYPHNDSCEQDDTSSNSQLPGSNLASPPPAIYRGRPLVASDRSLRSSQNTLDVLSPSESGILPDVKTPERSTNVNGAEKRLQIRPRGNESDGPRALSLTVKLTENRSFCRTKEPILKDVKIDIYYNGALSSSSLVPPTSHKKQVWLEQNFSGIRVNAFEQAPWILAPTVPSHNSNIDLPNNTISQQATAARRWNDVAKSIMAAADNLGRNKYGERPPSGKYLAKLASIPLPRTIEDYQGHTGLFGVVDVVLSIGISRISIQQPDLTRAEMLVDPRFVKCVDPCDTLRHSYMLQTPNPSSLQWPKLQRTSKVGAESFCPFPNWPSENEKSLARSDSLMPSTRSIQTPFMSGPDAPFGFCDGRRSPGTVTRLGEIARIAMSPGLKKSFSQGNNHETAKSDAKVAQPGPSSNTRSQRMTPMSSAIRKPAIATTIAPKLADLAMDKEPTKVKNKLKVENTWKVPEETDDQETRDKSTNPQAAIEALFANPTSSSPPSSSPHVIRRLFSRDQTPKRLPGYHKLGGSPLGEYSTHGMQSIVLWENTAWPKDIPISAGTVPSHYMTTIPVLPHASSMSNVSSSVPTQAAESTRPPLKKIRIMLRTDGLNDKKARPDLAGLALVDSLNDRADDLDLFNSDEDTKKMAVKKEADPVIKKEKPRYIHKTAYRGKDWKRKLSRARRNPTTPAATIPNERGHAAVGALSLGSTEDACKKNTVEDTSLIDANFLIPPTPEVLTPIDELLEHIDATTILAGPSTPGTQITGHAIGKRKREDLYDEIKPPVIEYPLTIQATGPSSSKSARKSPLLSAQKSETKFEVPELCVGSVLTCAEGSFVPVASEKGGEFEESEVLVGFRFVVSAV